MQPARMIKAWGEGDESGFRTQAKKQRIACNRLGAYGSAGERVAAALICLCSIWIIPSRYVFFEIRRFFRNRSGREGG